MQNSVNIDEKIKNIQENIEKIVKIEEVKSQNKNIFEMNSNNHDNLNNKSDNNILGELLSYVRQKKLVSTLALCRDIKKIEVRDGIAYVYSNDDSISELISNVKHSEVVVPFFKNKELGLKIVSDKDKSKDIDILRKMLNDELKITS